MDEAYVVDTDVISYVFRLDSRREQFEPYLTDTTVFVSFMTIAELERWTIERNWGTARARRLWEYVDSLGTVMVERPLCRLWAEVTTEARRKGRPIETADAWIAATALWLDVPLVTNNRDHFASIEGLRLLPADGG